MYFSLESRHACYFVHRYYDNFFHLPDQMTSWYMKSFIAKLVISILVNLRYLRFKLPKYKENNKKIYDTFDHKLQKYTFISNELGIIRKALFCILWWCPYFKNCQKMVLNPFCNQLFICSYACVTSRQLCFILYSTEIGMGPYYIQITFQTFQWVATRFGRLQFVIPKVCYSTVFSDSSHIFCWLDLTQVFCLNDLNWLESWVTMALTWLWLNHILT